MTIRPLHSNKVKLILSKRIVARFRSDAKHFLQVFTLNLYSSS